MSRLRRFGFRAGAIVVGLVVAFGIGEIVVRFLGHQPVVVKVHPVLPDKTPNPLGLRDPLDRVPKDPALLRIAFLGDSFTFGLGVSPEQTFVQRVGTLLRERYSGRSMAINLGRDGADLIGEWTIYNRVRDSVRPQVVVHVISQNDLDFDLYRSWEPIARLVSEQTWLSRHSRLFDLAERKIRSGLAHRRSQVYMEGGGTPEAQDRTWRIASHEIQQTKRLVEEGGAVYALVRFPWLRKVHLREDYPIEATHRRTAAVAERLGVPYLDLLEAFRGQPAEEMCLLPYDDHPSPAAHQIAAEAIATFLLREVIPKAHLVSATQPAPERTSRQIREAERQHYQAALAIDPNCFSAQFHLDRMATSQKAQ